MVCATGGQWCYSWRWWSEWRHEADPVWHSWAQGQSDPNLYGLRQCTPSCHANDAILQVFAAEDRVTEAHRALQDAIVVALREQAKAWRQSLEERVAVGFDGFAVGNYRSGLDGQRGGSYGRWPSGASVPE